MRAGRLRDPTGLAELLGAAKDSSGLSFSAEPMGDGGLSEPGVEDQRLVCKVTIPGEPTRRLMIRRLEDGRVSVEAFREHSILLADMVRFFPTNRLGIFQRLGVYASRWWEFLSGDPREAGMEGGFFPAIWGTVVMTIVMS